MKNIDERKSRYLLDSLPISMGGLAANLARVGSFAEHVGAKVAVIGLIEESKYFIEWTAIEFDILTTTELVDLQRRLALWHRTIDVIWEDDTKRLEIGSQAKEISTRLLAKSGLLNQ